MSDVLGGHVCRHVAHSLCTPPPSQSLAQSTDSQISRQLRQCMMPMPSYPSWPLLLLVLLAAMLLMLAPSAQGQVCNLDCIFGEELLDGDRQWGKDMPRALFFCACAILCSQPIILHVPHALCTFRLSVLCLWGQQARAARWRRQSNFA